MKAPDHGLEKTFGAQAVQMQRMIGFVSHGRHKRHLCTSIAIPKRMNGIKLAQELCGFLRKLFGRQITEISLSLQFAKHLPELSFNIFRITKGKKGFSPLFDTDASDPSRPAVNILEYVMTDGAKMPDAQSSVAQRLIKALSRHCGFEARKRPLGS